MKYSEKLQDPRWQRKRLEVMQRANFRCECCKDDKTTLQIHHLIYHRKKEPWDIDSNLLECLCRDCHEWREEFNRQVGGRCVQSTQTCQIFQYAILEVFAGEVKIERENHLLTLCQKAIIAWRIRHGLKVVSLLPQPDYQI